MITQRFGKGNVDWQQRIDWADLRKKRVARANTFLAKHGLGAAIIYGHDRKRYLSSVWNHPYGKHMPVHCVLFIRDAGFPYVPITKGLDMRVPEDCPWLVEEGKLLYEDQLLQPAPYRYQTPAKAKDLWGKTARQIKALLKKHGVADMPVGLDHCTPYLDQALMAEGLTVVDGNAWIDECCMTKFDEEIILMKMSASINETAYGALVKDFRVGMRENDVQAIMSKAIYESGAEYLEGWVVCSGDRTNPRSFNWSDRVIRPGEFLTAEACHVNYCGYKVCYDRTFLCGAKPTEMQKHVYQAAVDMHYKFRELIKPGVTTHELAESRPKPGENFITMAKMAEWKASWSNHFGGIGISWDSAPYFYSKDDPEFVLQRNMILAYHAIFCAEGDTGGVAIENTYRVTETGYEMMTKWPYEEIMTIGL